MHDNVTVYNVSGHEDYSAVAKVHVYLSYRGTISFHVYIVP